MSTETLTLGAILTAIVAVLQLLGSVTTFFGPFSTAVALVPIVIGAAMCGPTVGAWLGLVFGIVVLLSGGAALFLPFSVHGTLITVLAKGTVSKGMRHLFLYHKHYRWPLITHLSGSFIS